jgi:hypothetical protein
MRKLGFVALAVSITGLSLAGQSGCGSDGSTFDGGDGSQNGGDGCTGPFCNPFQDGTAGDGKTCTGLCLKQVNCGSAPTTSISGTVYDPADQVPLYNVAVYVPNAPLSPITHGATCDQCGSTLSGDPLVATLTDTAGHFKLDNVPVDSNLPLVIQIGKWRRHITIPNVTQCADNPITDKTQTRLPTKPQETSPDDDIPYMAITTGGADALECLLPKIGINKTQFVNQGSPGRVNLYQGVGGSALNGGSPNVTSFWTAQANLMPYDMVLLGCEGGTHPENKTGTSLPNMEAYSNAGGRVFGTHFHYYWIESNPNPSLWPSTATFDHTTNPPQTQWPVLIDQSFAKGQAFAQWMLNVGGSTTLGTFPIDQARHDVDAVNGQPTNDPVSIRWVYGQNPNVVEYYSFNTPVGLTSDKQCGKVVFSDLHVSAGDTPGGTFPANCNNNPLTPQEKALEFLLFDLSSCIQNDKEPPPPPVN